MNIKETVSRVFGNGEPPKAPDALTLIKNDHAEVAALFKVALGDDTPAARRRTAIAKITEALTVHAQMEEALFYPALRKAGGKDERDSVLEAAEEHGLVKDLIEKIQRSQGRDETMNAKVTVLKEIVEHHVKEEESEIFDEAKKSLGDERLKALGAEMQRFKERALKAPRAGDGTPAAKSAKRGTPSATPPSRAKRTAPRTIASTKKSTSKSSGAKKTARKTKRG